MLKNSRGFSLLQIIMAMGMVSVLSLAVMEISKSQAKISKKANSDSDLQDLGQIIRKTLSVPASCLKSVEGIAIDDHKHLDIVQVDPVTTSESKIVVQDQKFGQLNVISVQLKHYDPNNPTIESLLGPFVIETLVKVSGSQNLGGDEKKIRTLIFGIRDAANQLTECQSGLSDASLALLQKACEPHGFYNQSLNKCMPNTHTTAAPPPCDNNLKGVMSFNTDLAEMEVCNGTEWLGINNPYAKGNWYEVKNFRHNQGSSPANMSDLQSESFTLPFKACGFRINYFFDDGGFISVHDQSLNQVMLVTRHVDLACSASNAGCTRRDQNRQSCASYLPPNFNGGNFEYCIYRSTSNSGGSTTNYPNINGIRGQIFQVQSLHTGNSGNDHHRYTIEAKVCQQ
jgi:hypothetical protein